MRLSKATLTVEHHITPPLAVAITLPVEGAEHDGIVVYVGVGALAKFSRPGVRDAEWEQLVRIVAERLTLEQE